ncbi:24300_t:CDS:2 [Gigaspora margarita]|uniref:24300_t:CDS:1 n=1 Tax=Gigaspora margarita TaxID=4874 RepID=A0ABN7UV31_GIGMA|nr:24300_t:CDS:2 [Gigaspora margarita]
MNHIEENNGNTKEIIVVDQVKNNEQLPDNLIEIHDFSDVISQEFESVENSIDDENQLKDKEN